MMLLLLRQLPKCSNCLCSCFGKKISIIQRRSEKLAHLLCHVLVLFYYIHLIKQEKSQPLSIKRKLFIIKRKTTTKTVKKFDSQIYFEDFFSSNKMKISSDKNSHILSITRMLRFFQCLTILVNGFGISDGESSFSRIFIYGDKSKTVQIWQQK